MTEGPYKLPEGWRWVRLGEVCTLIDSGFAFRKKGAPEGDLLHLRPYNIGEDGTLNLSQRFYVPSSLSLARHKMLQPGDVLFNNTNSVELVGKTALVREPLEAAFSNHITLLRSDTTKAEGAWIALALQALWRQGFFANLCNKWIGQAGINTETLKSVLIPLPPLAEQRRIVARIEELMDRVREARRLQQEAQEDAERLWQSVLAQTFPRPGSELPEGWRWVRLGEVFRLRNGKFIRGGDLSTGGSVPVYGANGLLGFTATPLLTQGKTIVIGRVGACGAVNVVEAPCWISDNAMFVSQWYTDCDIDYIALALRSVDLSTFAKKGAQPSISQEAVYSALIPLPPLAEQRRIVAHLEAVQERLKALKEAQAATEAELKRLEQAILEKAFRGEL
jgi:type I restriction enzyme S subunit